MKVLVAPNTLRGSVDAASASEAIARGFARAIPDAEVVLLPIADGGELTASVLVRALGGTFETRAVTDPLGRPIDAAFGLCDGGKTAVIDAASASGIALIEPGLRDAMRATSYGTGELVRAALDRGCRKFILGLGGSATVDGGAGLMEALGARFLDAGGAPLERGGGALSALFRIDVSGLDPRVLSSEIVVACDVDNELLGERGAAAVFGPQKGATPEMVERLERGLAAFATVIERDLGRDVRSLRHGGAAGGMGAGIAGILGGRLERGIELVLEAVDFEARLEGCDLLITAEGMLDLQTLGNKGPLGVARAARKHGVPVVVIAGGIDDAVTQEEFSAFDAMFALTRRPMPREVAMERARELLSFTAEQIGRVYELGRAARSSGFTR
jgi:glycerate 2-kinase